MDHTRSYTSIRHRLIAVLLAMPLLALQPALAEDNSPERAQLAALVRQLDMLDRLAEHGASLSRQEDSRYHFDYARLREDIERVRSGIRDYLTPQRVQPRDPVTLIGDYRQESDEEAP